MLSEEGARFDKNGRLLGSCFREFVSELSEVAKAGREERERRGLWVRSGNRREWGMGAWGWKMRVVLGNVALLRYKTTRHRGPLYSWPTKPSLEIFRQREENNNSLKVSYFSLRWKDQYKMTTCLHGRILQNSTVL